MFKFFKRNKPDPTWADIPPINNLPEPERYPPMPPIPKKREPQQEFFRVGVTQDKQTTLTLIVEGGMSTTMTMDKATCEQMIKMLKATYQDE